MRRTLDVDPQRPCDADGMKPPIVHRPHVKLDGLALEKRAEAGLLHVALMHVHVWQAI